MNAKSVKGITLFILIFIVFSNSIPLVLGKTREKYLTAFLIECKIDEVGFSDSTPENVEISYEATAYALEMLKEIDDNFNQNINQTVLEESLKSSLKDALKNKGIMVYDFYYIFKSLNILEITVDQQDLVSIRAFLDETKVDSGGFSFNNNSKTVNIISTYYALALHTLVNKSIETRDIHEKWILACQNSDGGFGGTKSASSSIVSTYYAVSALKILYSLSKYEALALTAEYLNKTFIDNQIYTGNYGGYLPYKNANFALLSSTYFCSKAIALINESKLENKKVKTTNWVLDRQNSFDGGFIDNYESSEPAYSSVKSSYYAYETLRIFNPELDFFKEDVYEVEFNYWVLVVLGIGAGALITIYILIKRRRKLF